MTALGLQPFLAYPAVIKLRHEGEQRCFSSLRKAEDFVGSLSQSGTFAADPQGSGGRRLLFFFDPTGGAWWPVWRRWWLERYGWSLVQFLIFSSFLSPHGIVFLFYFYSIQPSLCWLTPFFWSFFFLEGTNGEWVSLQWCFGSVSLLGGSLWAEVARSRIITSFCCSIRPMFSVTCGLNCFLSIIVSHFCLFCFYFLQQIFMLLFTLPCF